MNLGTILTIVAVLAVPILIQVLWFGRTRYGAVGARGGPGSFDAFVADLRSAKRSVVLSCRKCQLVRYTKEQRETVLKTLSSLASTGIEVQVSTESAEENVLQEIRALSKQFSNVSLKTDMPRLAWYGRLIDEQALTVFYGRQTAASLPASFRMIVRLHLWASKVGVVKFSEDDARSAGIGTPYLQRNLTSSGGQLVERVS